MADISSYPQATPKGSDRVLGVQAYVEGDDSTAGNPTKTFTINDINNLVPRSDGDSLYIDTEISSAQILDLHNTPVELVPAQGAGTVVFVDKVIAKYTFGTTPYTQQGNNILSLDFVYNGVEAATASSKIIFLDTVQDQYYLNPNFERNLLTPTSLLNLPVTLIAVPPITLGDGTIKIRTYYSVIPSTF